MSKIDRIRIGEPHGHYDAKITAMLQAGLIQPGVVILTHRGVHPGRINRRTDELGMSLGATRIFVDHEPGCAARTSLTEDCDCDPSITDPRNA